MKRIMYLVIWGVCIRPVTKAYYADAMDEYGALYSEPDFYDYREGNGYLFAIQATFDLMCDKSPLQLFVEGDNRESNFSALHRAPDGVVSLTPDDLRYFEPGEIVELNYYTVESDAEAEALNSELGAPNFVDEFPNMRRYYAFNPDQIEF